MLKALVEEMNRYNESPQQVLELLNARPTTDTDGEYTIDLLIDGVQAPRDSYYPTRWEGSPMREQEISIRFDGIPDNSDNETGSSTPSPTSPRRKPRSCRQDFVVRQEHLAKFDAAKGEFQYDLAADGMVVRFSRIKVNQANYINLLA
jgi:hypothetical protein